MNSALVDADMPWLEAECDDEALGPDVAPEVPDWLAELPMGTDDFPPDCACCVEPDPVRPKDIGWAIPGVTTVAPPAEAPPPPSRLIAELMVLVDRLGNQCVASLPEAQARVDADALLTAVERLRVQSLDRIADVHTRKLHDPASFHSTAGWLQHAHPDTTDLPLAKKLSRYPFVKQRVHDGAVGINAARKTVSALEQVRRYVDRPDGFIDGQPGGPVVNAVVGHVVDLACRFRMGLANDYPLLAQLVARTEEISELGARSSSSSSGASPCSPSTCR